MPISNISASSREAITGSTIEIGAELVSRAAISALNSVLDLNKIIRTDRISELRKIYSDTWFNRIDNRKLVKFFKKHRSNDLVGVAYVSLLELLSYSERWSVELTNSSWSTEIHRLRDIVDVTSGCLGVKTVFISFSDIVLIKRFTKLQDREWY